MSVRSCATCKYNVDGHACDAIRCATGYHGNHFSCYQPLYKASITWRELSKERPEIGDMVLIYMPNENGKGNFARGITAAEYQGINYLDNEKYWFIGQRREFNEDDITHWAYLPEPPIAESED